MRVWQNICCAAMALSVLASCSTATEDPVALAAEAWKAEIQQAKDQAREQANELIQAVLDDNQVTEAELQQVEGQFDACVTSAGFAGGGYSRRLEGGYYIEGLPEGLSESAANAVVNQCAATSSIEIVEFAVRQRVNPANVDMIDLSSQCMKARGLLERQYTSHETEEFVTVVEALSEADKAIALECNIDPRKYLDEASR